MSPAPRPDGGVDGRLDSSPRGRAWFREHRVWLMVVLAYVTVFPYSPGINNPNENVRIYLTRALVEHHEIAINKIEAEWGTVNDKAKNGARVFSGKAPGTSLLGVPVLAAETWLWHRLGWPSPSKLATTLALRELAITLPMCLFLFAFSGYCRRLSASRAVADLLLVAVGLGSLLYPYGIHFVGHSLAAALSFSAFMVLAPSGTITTSTRRAAMAGLLAGLGVVFEYQNILVGALLAVYVAARRPALLAAFLLGTVPAAAVLGVMHTLCFGRPWDFPYGHLENLEFQAAHHDGFFGVVAPARAAILGMLFLPGFGFFAGSPFLIVATLAVGWMVARGPRAEGLLAAAVPTLLTVFIAGLPNWRGGWSVGPRYIAALVPYLAIGLAYGWPRLVRNVPLARAAWLITAALVVAAVFVNSLAAVIYPQVPPQVRNPLFQVLLRLPLDGYYPYSLGYAMGLRGLFSVAPTALAIGLAVIFTLTPHTREKRANRFAHHPGGDGILPAGRMTLPVAVLGCAAILVPFSSWPARWSVGERQAIHLVESTFTPVPAIGTPAR